jgi:orotidine-5'-phosphate decarboxylase
VIGRAVTGAPDPRQALMDIARTLDQSPSQTRI